VDITVLDQVKTAFEKSPSEVVIHFAAFTDVTKAWEQKGDKSGIAWQVNVLGTQNVISAAKQSGKHLIHISTAYVFDGENTQMYTEEDQPHPIEWYGQTKFEAEQLIKQSDINWTILRIDQPFRSDPFPKLDTAHRIIEGIKLGKLYPQFTDHFFGPTFIDDFVKVINFFIRTQTKGLFHASSGEMWSDFDFAQSLNQALNLGGEIQKGSLDTYLKTLNRPYQKNTALNCQKLKQILDFELTPISQAVKKISF
jgi:dTDP-4-dehydrorhamnose reductase